MLIFSLILFIFKTKKINYLKLFLNKNNETQDFIKIENTTKKTIFNHISYFLEVSKSQFSRTNILNISNQKKFYFE